MAKKVTALTDRQAEGTSRDACQWLAWQKKGRANPRWLYFLTTRANQNNEEFALAQRRGAGHAGMQGAGHPRVLHMPDKYAEVRRIGCNRYSFRVK